MLQQFFGDEWAYATYAVQNEPEIARQLAELPVRADGYITAPHQERALDMLNEWSVFQQLAERARPWTRNSIVAELQQRTQRMDDDARARTEQTRTGVERGPQGDVPAEGAVQTPADNREQQRQGEAGVRGMEAHRRQAQQSGPAREEQQQSNQRGGDRTGTGETQRPLRNEMRRPAANQAQGEDTRVQQSTAGSRDARSCPLCAHMVGVAMVARVASELAIHINVAHPNADIEPAILLGKRLAQCAQCRQVGPNRSFGHHTCAARIGPGDAPGTVDEAPIIIPRTMAPRFRTRGPLMAETPMHGEAVWAMAVKRRLTEYTRNPCERTRNEFLDLPTVCLPLKYRKKRLFERHVYAVLANEEWREPADAGETRMSDEQRRRSRVARLCQIGAFSKAFRTLTSEGIHPMSDEVMAKVRRLFPEGEPMAHVECEPFFSASEVREAIWRLPRGASAGPSGWTRELLAPALEDEETAAMLARLLSSIDETLEDLLGVEVVPLKKGEDGVRPVALQETLIKLIGKMCLSRCREAVEREIGLTQYGLKGSEAAVHKVRELWEADRTQGIVTIDCTNAYGCLNREMISIAEGSRGQDVWQRCWGADEARASARVGDSTRTVLSCHSAGVEAHGREPPTHPCSRVP